MFLICEWLWKCVSCRSEVYYLILDVMNQSGSNTEVSRNTADVSRDSAYGLLRDSAGKDNAICHNRHLQTYKIHTEMSFLHLMRHISYQSYSMLRCIMLIIPHTVLFSCCNNHGVINPTAHFDYLNERHLQTIRSTLRKDDLC